MINKKLRIMHGLSEVAGQNAYSVLGLRAIGEKAETIVYYKHPFAYPYDKCLNLNKSNKVKYPIYIMKLALFFLLALYKYNCFHFHFGHSILNCIELKIYKLLKKKVFFEFHGSDLRDQKKFCEINGLEFDINDATNPKLHLRNKKICKMADGIIVHDDELIPYLPNDCESVYVVPLRVDIMKFKPNYPNVSTTKIKIVHAPSNKKRKGTKYVFQAYEKLKEKYNNIELVLVEGKTQNEAIEIYKTADIIIDQLCAGTYGVFAIESMAIGKPVITYISDEMKKHLPSALPIISANIYNIDNVLEELILNSELRRNKGIDGRKYVENYHNYKYIAYMLRDIYCGNMKPMAGREAFDYVKKIRQRVEKIDA